MFQIEDVRQLTKYHVAVQFNNPTWIDDAYTIPLEAYFPNSITMQMVKSILLGSGLKPMESTM